MCVTSMAGVVRRRARQQYLLRDRDRSRTAHIFDGVADEIHHHFFHTIGVGEYRGAAAPAPVAAVAICENGTYVIVTDFSSASDFNSSNVDVMHGVMSTGATLIVSRPACERATSSRSFTSWISRWFDAITFSMNARVSSGTGPVAPSKINVKYPFIAATGVRNSCAAMKTNSSFQLLKLFEAEHHVVERVAELFDLIAGRDVDAFVKFPLRHAAVPSSNFLIGCNNDEREQRSRAGRRAPRTMSKMMISRRSSAFMTASASDVGHSATSPQYCPLSGSDSPAATTFFPKIFLYRICVADVSASVPPITF